MNTPFNIAVVIFPGVELVDMNGPIDVFYHAANSGGHAYNIYTVAQTTDPVLSEGGIVSINPGFTLRDCPEPEIIIIPGKLDSTGTPVTADQEIIDWVKDMVAQEKTILSVCVGFYTLAATGALNGRKATTHYLSINGMHDQYPEIELIKNVRYVEDGIFVTTAGITSGINGALYLVEQLDGPDLAQMVADIMIYNRDAPLPEYTILPPYYLS